LLSAGPQGDRAPPGFCPHQIGEGFQFACFSWPPKGKQKNPHSPNTWTVVTLGAAPEPRQFVFFFRNFFLLFPGILFPFLGVGGGVFARHQREKNKKTRVGGGGGGERGGGLFGRIFFTVPRGARGIVLQKGRGQPKRRGRNRFVRSIFVILGKSRGGRPWGGGGRGGEKGHFPAGPKFKTSPHWVGAGGEKTGS